MILPKLIKATLVKRYKRFFVDALLENGKLVTAHCPNSGSMKGLLSEGNQVFLSKSTNPKNKLNYKLEIVLDVHSLVGVNTQITNKLAFEALRNKKIRQLSEFDIIKPESVYNKSRFDFLLSNDAGQQAFVEVKNVTLKRYGSTAEFPDAITDRGSKHLLDLIDAKNNCKNTSATNLYIIQRSDVDSFKIAKDIDKKYYENFLTAKKSGVNFLCYSCEISEHVIELKNEIEIIY